MFHALLDAIFPPQCAGCSAIGIGLCERCLPFDEPPLLRVLPTLRVYALGDYRGALRRAVLALKDGRRDVAQALGERLAAMISAPMLLVPVRTTRARRRVRGIDGVEYVARIAARRTGASVACALEPIRGDAQRGRSRFATDSLAASSIRDRVGRKLCTQDRSANSTIKKNLWRGLCLCTGRRLP